jgi:hypothetical protein
MGTAFKPARLSFFPETTSGTGPADWAADGQSIRHMDLDLTPFKETMLEDMRSRLAISRDREAPIPGIKGSVEFPFSIYLTGAEDTAITGEQLLESTTATVIGKGMGGIRRAQSQTVAVAGATSTLVVETVVSTGLVVGDFVQMADSNGVMHQRRVTAIAAGGVGQILTLHRALPFTPADGSLVVGCITLHIDEDVKEDSQVGPYTWSFLGEIGRQASTARRATEAVGCEVMIESIELSRNGLPMVKFKVLVGSFETSESTTSPTWTDAPTGAAPVPIGPRSRVFLQDRGTTTNATLNVSSFEIDPGLPAVRVETMTEDTTGLPGTYGYTLGDAPCTVKFNIVPHTNDHLDDFAARTERHLQFERLAPAGQAWSIYFPRVVHNERSSPADANGMLGQSLSFEALHDDDMTTDVSMSRMVIVLG